MGVRTDTDMAPDPALLMLAGDWHGNLPWAESVIRHAADRDVDTILQLGDFGYWTDDPATDEYLSTVDDLLESSGIRLYWIDGNHEDHTRVDDWTDAYRHPRVRYLPRGFRWQWWGLTWMSVGGAMSVDKHYRLEGESWWPGEELTDADVEYASRDGGVDVIVSHDCPRGVDIPGVGPDTKGGARGNWPADILAEAQRHREKLAAICSATTPAWLYHGHYHIPYTGSLAATTVRGLGHDRSTLADNVHIITRDDLGATP
ncbi:metallophosphoesterase family protein [Mycolicibacterium arenosum]|uniref:Metallophosphoesterase n=1 Tax=Mycolicibacterium arenosum TaxID=2952157 RepID=A0ABT1LZY1_9MYCO|nr:metallophosphoesterase family protein [Mycolicibacterium sp. CAU 1645]MCP9272451.1 metallophosphoesterase [Mycolicibacterium sp. CAU 1645]